MHAVQCGGSIHRLNTAYVYIRQAVHACIQPRKAHGHGLWAQALCAHVHAAEVCLQPCAKQHSLPLPRGTA